MASNSSTKKLLVEKHNNGSIYVLAINKPDKMNCICREVTKAMCETFEEFMADEKAHVAIITGKGSKAFSAGGTLSDTDACHGTGVACVGLRIADLGRSG